MRTILKIEITDESQEIEVNGNGLEILDELVRLCHRHQKILLLFKTAIMMYETLDKLGGIKTKEKGEEGKKEEKEEKVIELTPQTEANHE